MSLLGKLMAPRRQAQAFTEDFWTELFSFGRKSKSGATVNTNTALQVTVVLACLRVLAQGVAQVPKNVMRQDGRDNKVADDHELQWVLHHQPNPWQTSFEFFEQLVFHAALAGRFIAFKNVVRGRVVELIPFLPHEVCIDVDQFRRITYRVSSEVTGLSQEFPAEAIWHVKGPSWNGWDGMEILKLAAEAIGLSIATEEAHSLMHANAGQAGGIYSVEGTLNRDQYQGLRNWIESNMTGGNRFRPFVLDRNAKFTPTSMTGVDQQHLETRKHQIEEIARVFGVAPILIGHSDKASTFASAEQFFLAHVVHTLMPWYRRIEESINVNLLGKQAVQQGYYAKFNANALLRGAAADRANFYNRLWAMGALSANEIRSLEDMNPYQGGDTYRVQLNMADASQPVNQNAASTGQTANPQQEENDDPAASNNAPGARNQG